MDKKKILIACIALGVLLVGTMVWFFVSENSGKAGNGTEKSVTATLPDGEVQRMTDSKSEAFRGRVSTDDYFDQLGARQADDEDISLVSEEGDSRSKPGMTTVPQESSGEAAVARTFGGPPPSSAPAAATPSCRSSGGGSASRPMTEQERLDYDRRRAEMVRDVLVGGASEETPGQTGSDEPAPVQTIDLSALGSSEGIISSLDDDNEDASVQYGDGEKRPFKCMFVRDQKLTSGQRVTLRLLEDYNMDGVRIPANTHLAAICKIGDRLELQVRSLEMNGRIIPLALDAYDTDGLQGIYCPETSASRNRQKASTEAISTAGTTFGGLVGDIASTVIRTGASIARSASGEVSVSVVSGYEFYLVKSDRR
jgi:hypothetical protein